ncbi:hypothetical protein FZC76_04645 [Sutcliffiella horikoshii]|uniref:Uncharacterized protein n=1 Tax=Sutcliffiella horikoshii TaxID=79883 RepID=A0A5D4T1H9_9BACI|nr:DUF6773 family protein [Sutcliffiella horikoshii]TYS69527.1 hypothetical protein FZC76_04645 [Sutcliffiella horikoshii]
MNIFGGATKVEDERIVNIQNKIYREIYFLVMAICLISIGFKFYQYGFGVNSIHTELAILFLQGVYYTVRGASMGVLSDEVEIHDRKSKVPMKWKTLFWGGASGVIIAIFFGLNSAFNYADTTAQAYSYFFMVFFVSLMIYIPFLVLLSGSTFLAAMNRSKKAAEKELDEDEIER